MLKLSFGTVCVDKTQQSLAITSALLQQPLCGVLHLSDDCLCLPCTATKTNPFENNYENYRDTIHLESTASEDAHSQLEYGLEDFSFLYILTRSFSVFLLAKASTLESSSP